MLEIEDEIHDWSNPKSNPMRDIQRAWVNAFWSAQGPAKVYSTEDIKAAQKAAENDDVLARVNANLKLASWTA